MREQDTVVFMTSFKINRLKKRISLRPKKQKISDLLVKHHISMLAMQNVVLTKEGRFKLSTVFDEHRQLTSFQFTDTSNDEDRKSCQHVMKEMAWSLALTHSMEILLDKSLFEFAFFASMERFLVTINSRLLQVDPIVFCLNDVVFVHFELIDFQTSIPLTKDEILGRSNNYNIIPVNSLRYFSEESFRPDNRNISDIIIDNLNNYFDMFTSNKFSTADVSHLHNILVFSNDIVAVDDYFLQVMGAEKLKLSIKNLSTTNVFEYYSFDGLGVVTSIADEAKPQSLSDCQLLESLKMYFYINQYANFTITENLQETIDRQMHIERLVFVHGVPIITLNLLDNLKQTDTYKRNNDAINFKVSFLTLHHERRKSSNAVLLNILLYILSYIGGISALEVLHNQFCWPFTPMAIALSVIFVGLGICWVYYERKK